MDVFTLACLCSCIGFAFTSHYYLKKSVKSNTGLFRKIDLVAGAFLGDYTVRLWAVQERTVLRARAIGLLDDHWRQAPLGLVVKVVNLNSHALGIYKQGNPSFCEILQMS